MPVAKAKSPDGTRFRLLVRGREVELPLGVLLVGRDPSCGLVLDDSRASRRHAEIKVTEIGCTLTDLGSANGSYINGERLRGPRVILGGDRITFAQTDIPFIDSMGSPVSTGSPGGAPPGVPPLAVASPAAASPTRVRPDAPARTSATKSDLLDDDATVVTGQLDSFQLFGRLADQAFSEHDVERAGHILSAQFRAILAGAKRRGHAEPDALEFMARYALRLSLATRDATWIDGTFRVFSVARRPVPPAFVEEVRGALRRLPPLDRQALHDYVEALRAASDMLSPTERFVIQHLATLEQLVKALVGREGG